MSTAARAVLESLARLLENGRAVALVTVLGGPGPVGAKLLVSEEGGTEGSTGSKELDGMLADEARPLLSRGATSRKRVGDLDVFVQSFARPPVLYVIGAVHPAAALAEAGRFLGFRVVVCDPRSPFATPERLPAAHEIVRDWPGEFFATRRLTSRDAVCVLTHDLKFDVPALEAALASPVGYVGVMGSRKTHERRTRELSRRGVGDDALARLHAPIGVDIGARTPAEMAVSIVAEIVRERSGVAAPR